MKTTTLSVLLSVVSLGGVAMLYVKVDDLSEQLRLSRADRAGSPGAASEENRPNYVIHGGQAARPESGGDDAGKAAVEDGASPEPSALSVEDRLARLEKKEAERRRTSTWDHPGFRTRHLARNVDELGSQLNLTASQKDRVRSAIERGKARIDEILSIPGPDGKSIKQLREENRKRIQKALSNPEKNAGALVTLAMSGHQRMNEKIPGRNETYRQEVDRIKKETRDEIGSTLSPEQQKSFADTEIDPMLGESSRMAIATSISMGGADGDTTEGAGMMIAEDVVIDTEGSEKSGGTKEK